MALFWLSLLLIFFVVEIPVVGAGLSFLVHIFGMGCLLVHLRNLYMRSRDSTACVNTSRNPWA